MGVEIREDPRHRVARGDGEDASGHVGRGQAAGGAGAPRNAIDA
jgi:hypothetical protein